MKLAKEKSISILEMIPKMIFLTLSIGLIVFVTFLYKFNNLETSDIEMDIFFNRLIYSSNAITYYDEEIGRSYLGIIDPEKLNSETLEEAINYPKDRTFAAKIKINGIEESVYYKKEIYEDLEPLAGIRGAGGVSQEIKEMDVSFMKDGEPVSRTMTIDILRSVT